MAENEGIQNNKVGGTARITYSVFSETGPDLVGMTIGQARAKFGNLWSIDKQASAYQGKELLDENHVIGANENITFVRRQGEKGRKAFTS